MSKLLLCSHHRTSQISLTRKIYFKLADETNSMQSGLAPPLFAQCLHAWHPQDLLLLSCILTRNIQADRHCYVCSTQTYTATFSFCFFLFPSFYIPRVPQYCQLQIQLYYLDRSSNVYSSVTVPVQKYKLRGLIIRTWARSCIHKTSMHHQK